MAWTSFMHGSSQDPVTSSPMGTRGFQEEARSTATELERSRLEGPEENERQLGRGEEAAKDRKSWRNRVIKGASLTQAKPETSRNDILHITAKMVKSTDAVDKISTYEQNIQSGQLYSRVGVEQKLS